MEFSLSVGGKNNSYIYFIQWIIIHSISVWFSIKIIEKFNLFGLTGILVAGIIITIFAAAFRTLIQHLSFDISSYTTFWILLNSFGYWAGGLIAEIFSISSNWLLILLIGFSLAIIGKIGGNVRISQSYYRKIAIGFFVLFIFSLFLPNSAPTLPSHDATIFDGTTGKETSLYQKQLDETKNSIAKTMTTIMYSLIGLGVLVGLVYLAIISNKPRERSPEEQAAYNRRRAEIEAERDFGRRW